MRFIRTFMGLLAVMAAACAGAANTTVVARVQERAVTLDDLDQAGGRTVYDAAHQLYEARVRALYQLLSQEVLAREAGAAKITVDELLDKNVPQQPAITAAELDTWLKSQPSINAQDAQVRRQAAVYLAARRRGEQKRAYVNTLFDKYGVRVSLDPPADPPLEEVRGAVTPAIGAEGAPVTLTVFSDYRCGYCREFSRTLDQLMEQYPKELSIVYRHFPVQADSGRLAEAALCAADEGRFAEYHRLLFGKKAGDATQVEDYARELGLDGEKFSACLASKRHAQRVQEDLAEGQRLGIQGTPTLFINGLRLRGAQPLQRLSAQVQEALRRHPRVSAAHDNSGK